MRVVDRGTIDDRDCAFPQAALLADGSLVCTYSNAGGQFATGGTDLAHSPDGRDWHVRGTLLAATDDPPTSNHLKVSRAAQTDVLYAYGARSTEADQVRFGERRSEAVFCSSSDGAATWTDPQTVPFPTDALEVSHGILALRSGRLLAPAATIETGRLGERVLVAISDDGGSSWESVTTAMRDPEGRLGYLEQKLAELADGRVLATAWTVRMEGVADQPNSYAISDDGGATWTPPSSMGILGQTLSALHLGDEDFLLLYNRRYGQQGVVAARGRLDGTTWTVADELLAYDAQQARDRSAVADGVDEMLEFAFGFPTGVVLGNGTCLVTHWSVDDGRCGVRWLLLDL